MVYLVYLMLMCARDVLMLTYYELDVDAMADEVTPPYYSTLKRHPCRWNKLLLQSIEVESIVSS